MAADSGTVSGSCLHVSLGLGFIETMNRATCLSKYARIKFENQYADPLAMTRLTRLAVILPVRVMRFIHVEGDLRLDVYELGWP